MKIFFTKWMKGAFVVSLLLGASTAYATITTFEEQILYDTGFNGNNAKAGGYSVAIGGEWAFVGDSTKCQVIVYKFNVEANRWGDGTPGLFGVGKGYTYLVNATSACPSTRVEGFGRALSTDNGLLAVGAPLADVDVAGQSIKDAGAVFIYKYDDTQKTCDTDTCRKGWVLTATSEGAVDENGPDAQLNAHYGAAVSIRQTGTSGDARLVIGAPDYDDVTNGADAGKVYFWEYADGGGFTFKAAAAGEKTGDKVGTAVTSNGTEMLASAPYHDTGTLTDSGAVYLFDYSETTASLDLEFKFENGDAAGTPSLSNNYHLGISLSYADTVIALGGEYSNIYDHDHPDAPVWRVTSQATLEGDVSQSGSVINLARRGTASSDGIVNIIIDKYDAGLGTVAPTYQITKSEEDWGRDVSTSLPNIMVNGNLAKGTNQPGVAYAYFAGCGFGGNLKANEWKMIGPQCKVYSDAAFTVDANISEVYSDLGTYGTDWIMYRQDGADYSGSSASYWTMGPGESMVVGVGYWIMSLTEQTYQVSTDLYAKYIDKIVPAPAVDDSSDRSNIRAVTDLNLTRVMGGYNNGRDGDNDIRTMFSNPLIASTVWADATMLTATFNYLVGVSAKNLFEGSDATAYVWHNGTGSVGAGYTPVSGTPGLTEKIEGGEGFSVKFSNNLPGILDTNDLSLQLAEQY